MPDISGACSILLVSHAGNALMPGARNILCLSYWLYWLMLSMYCATFEKLLGNMHGNSIVYIIVVNDYYGNNY